MVTSFSFSPSSNIRQREEIVYFFAYKIVSGFFVLFIWEEFFLMFIIRFLKFESGDTCFLRIHMHYALCHICVNTKKPFLHALFSARCGVLGRIVLSSQCELIFILCQLRNFGKEFSMVKHVDVKHLTFCLLDEEKRLEFNEVEENWDENRKQCFLSRDWCLLFCWNLKLNF